MKLLKGSQGIKSGMLVMPSLYSDWKAWRPERTRGSRMRAPLP